MQDTWVCLIPFLIVIPISMWTKQVQPGLFVGLLVGSYLMYPSLLGGLEHMIHYLVSNIVVKNNIRIVLFLYAFAGLVGMIKFTGGIKGFVHMIAHKIKTKKGAMLLTWLSTLGTFSEPDFRIVTIAPIMKALQKRLHMSKRRIAYAIEFTANPVIALVPVATAFVGYMVSVIGQSLHAAGIHQTPYIVYVKSIPFNFFSFVIILVGIYYSFIKKPKKGEDAAFEKARGEEEKFKQAGSATGAASSPQPVNARAEPQTVPNTGMLAGNVQSPVPNGDMQSLSQPNAGIQQGKPAMNMEMANGTETNNGSLHGSEEANEIDDLIQTQIHLMQAETKIIQAQTGLLRNNNRMSTADPNSPNSADPNAVQMNSQQPDSVQVSGQTLDPSSSTPGTQQPGFPSQIPEPSSTQSVSMYETQYPNPGDVSSGNADPANGLQQPADNMKNSAVGMPSNPAAIPEGPLSTEANTFTNATPNMQMGPAAGGTMDIHGGTTGMYEQPTIAQQQEEKDLKKKSADDLPHADQQEDLNESHRAYKKETPIRPWNLIIPIGLFLSLTLFLSWWDGHTKTRGFFNAFIKSDMLGVMLTSLLTAVIVALAYFIFQKFSVAGLATHFIKGGNELLNVIVMLSLIWALTAVSEDLGFSHYITAHVKGLIPGLFIAPSLFVLGMMISYFIGSSWGTWGLLMPLGVTLAAESHTSILLAIGAVFASGTFGAFASPLSDNTVTTCTVLDLPVVKYARSKLVPALIAAGISVILFGVASFFFK